MYDQPSESLTASSSQSCQACEALEAEIIRQKQWLQTFGQQVPAALHTVIHGLDGRVWFEYLSQTAEEIYEIPLEQILADASLVLDKAIHPEDRAAYEMAVADCVAYLERGELKPFRHEWRIITPSGQVKWLQVGSQPTPWRDGLIAWHGITHDITERKETEMALYRAKEAAEASARSKSEFLAMMSHELRTPLNAVLGMNSLLLNSDLSQTQRQWAETIRDGGELLLAIISDLLDLSHIESGRLELNLKPCNLKDCVEAIANILAPRALDKNLGLTIDWETDIPDLVMVDEPRIQQILLNLISNAIKFTEIGTILVSVQTILQGDGDKIQLQFSVQDTGIGIPSEQLNSIFQPFRQVDRFSQRRYDGTGLGLAICRRLCDCMGGEIRVSSILGEGSTFEVQLPASLVNPSSLGNPTTGPDAQTFAPPPALRSGSPFCSKTWAQTYPLRILVAEDNRLNQIVMDRVLEQLGYEPVIVDNGREVLRALAKGFYDLILMDIQMPEMDGLEVTQWIRSQPIQADLGPSNFIQPRIVGVSASAFETDRRAALAAGMDDYLAKPINRHTIMEVIQRLGQRVES